MPKINIEEQKSLPKPKKWPKVDTTKGEFVPPIPQEQKNEKTPEEKAKEEESENLLRNIEEMITKPMPKPPIVEIPSTNTTISCGTQKLWSRISEAFPSGC